MKPDFASNAGFAMFANVLYLATRILLPPLVLLYLPLAEYGLWSVCFVLIMYIGLTDVGFSNVYVRFCAQYYALGDSLAINRLLSTGVFTLALLSLMVWCALWLCLPQMLDWLKVAEELRDKAQVLVLGTAAMFLLDLSLGAYCYLLHGLQRFREEKKIAMVCYLLEFVLIWLFLRAGFGVYSLLLAFVVRYVCSLTLFMRLAHQILPSLRIHPGLFDKQLLRHFFGFGVAVQISTLLGTALFSLDKLLAGLLLGPKGIALFELGAKFPVSAIAVPSNISNVAMPTAANLVVQHDMQGLQRLYQQTSRMVCLLAGLPLAFMVLFASQISMAWLGSRDELAQLPLILAMTALYSHLHVTTGPGSAVFRAQGNVTNEFIYHGLRLLGISMALGGCMLYWGASLYALVLGLCCGNSVAALLYLLYNQYKLGGTWGDLCREILLPGASAYLLAAGMMWLWQVLFSYPLGRWQTLNYLVLFGCVYVLCWAGLVYVQLHAHERQRLWAMLPMLQWRKS